MKRAGDLMEQIVDPENLYQAWRKTIRGRRDSPAVAQMASRLDRLISRISDDLWSGNYQWGRLEHFVIHDPKERVIHVASLQDRMVHHAIMNICEPIFERFQIDASYACRKGKGQFAALDKALFYARKNARYLKLDIRKYFPSISHDVLKSLLSRLFKDPSLLDLFSRLIDSHRNEGEKGLPIGSLTSQFFANHYLARFDHFVKENLRIGPYLRYMDDFVLWGNEKTSLISQREKVDHFLRKTLHLQMKPPVLNRTRLGMTFLGFRVFPSGLRLSHRGRYRFRRKYRQALQCYERGQWSEEELARHLEPLFVVLKHADSKAFRRRVLSEG